MDKPNEVITSWNLKYQDLKDCLRPPCPLDSLIENQWVSSYRSLPQGYYCGKTVFTFIWDNSRPNGQLGLGVGE